MATQAAITDFFQGSSSTASMDSDEAELSQPAPKKTKHRDSGFDQAWRTEFTWLHVEEDQDGVAMFCALCRKHNQTTKRMVWIEVLCCLLRKDKLREHQLSKCHMDSICAESHAAAAKFTGGIRSALQKK